MLTINEFVQNLADYEKISIIENFELFEKQGFIGDEPLRIYTKKFLNLNNISEDQHMAHFMTLIANGCYRYFAKKYLSQQCQNSQTVYTISLD